MDTKEKLLLLLEEKRGDWLSGEEIAAQLDVSRTAVWKAVKTLQGAGYQIDAVRNKGYCLAARTDVLSAQGIRKYLSPEWDGAELTVLAAVSSTNALLREKAAEGAPEGSVLLAGAQSKGRGRLGRSFYSPSDTGIYMSLLLRPQLPPQETVKITTMAAVAACEAIEAVSGREAGIKWVNDIIMDGRKVCGILTEGAFHLESGSTEYVILGVGINAYEPEDGFPEEIAGIAGSVFRERVDDGKNRLAAEFLNRFSRIYHGTDSESYAESYRRKSLVIGREINVVSANAYRWGTALDVDNDCRLVVRFSDGTVEALSSAEVSIRPV